MGRNINVSLGIPWILIMIILCIGEPDLLDGLIHYLMNCGAK